MHENESMKITADVGVTQLGELTTVSAMLVLLELAKLLKEFFGLLLLLSGHDRYLKREYLLVKKRK